MVLLPASASTGPHDHRPAVSGERSRFDARVERLLPVVAGLLEALYPDADIDLLSARLVHELEAAFDSRKPELLLLDSRRATDSLWFQRPEMIGYVAYADRFGGTLEGVEHHLDYLGELHVNYLHLMKVLRARRGANDGGYAVEDYGDVDPELGTRDDLERLVDSLRERGISLCLDLVMNHTAQEHAWAVAARAGSAKHREYYLTFPDRTMPDRYEATLPDVFPEMAPGNFTWDDELEAWVWTTFNTYQWDLNYANPDVLVEMLRIMLDLANLGVEVLRLDAIAFTWKRMGTNCQNQPEAHLIAQVYRALLEIAAPATVLKAEAIVAPSDLLPYLGVHRQQRRECHLAYHNQLMVMLWSSLASKDAKLAAEALAALPPTPPTAGWVTYVRCHDDIGWAVSDADAARAAISGPAHRSFLASFYRGDFPGSYAEGAPFSSNHEIGDERTSGTAAALSGITSARRSDTSSLDHAVRRLLVAYGVMIGFGGIPLIYMGDELALGNDTSYLDDPTLADDSRWMNRPWMPWDVAALRDVAGTVECRVFSAMRHFVEVRRNTPAMTGGGETWIHELPDTAALGWARMHPEHGRFYGVANFADRVTGVPRAALGWAGIDEPREVLHSGDVTLSPEHLLLAPYGIAWFVDGRDTSIQPVPPALAPRNGGRR
jgi:amylosucrase